MNNGCWTEKTIRKATHEEARASNSRKDNNNDITYMSCANPECDNLIKILRSPKPKFNTTYPLRYKRYQMIYCSEVCQQEHDKILKNNVK